MGILKNLLQDIYPENAEQILKELSTSIPDEPINNQKPDWYKDMCLYVTYPDSFCEDKECDLNALTKKVEYIKKLGFNAIHVLPFFNSPMIDAGFDVSDYLSVRKDLGGNKAFNEFLIKCKEEDINVFADIVLNHISFEHEWFQKAVSGDEKYQDFFIWKKDKPKFIKKFQKDGKTWARYEVRGKTQDIFLIFPEQVGKIPHWYQGKDGYWYYHTFYPHQIDLDWNNPQVFIEFAKVLAFWTSKNLSFRLDAIPFLGKDVERGIFTDDSKTQKVVQALHEVVKSVSKDSVFLAEVPFKLDKIKGYFGCDDIVESELCYNFPLNAKFWLSLITENAEYIWEKIANADCDVPDWAHWVNFIRNHDALMIDRIDKDEKKLLYDKLEPRGLPFADATNVSGRTFSFLEKDIKRHIMSYFLLASLPGTPAIIYGDEIGKENDFTYMKKMAQWKRDHLKDPSIAEDNRDISRGHIREVDIDTEKADIIYSKLSKIFNSRCQLSDKFRRHPKQIKLDDSIFAARYDDFTVYINLSRSPKEINVQSNEILLKCNHIELHEGKLVLDEYAGVWLKNN
jgi:maltose alpha-D-glucosyltransferase/alpha-amylase